MFTSIATTYHGRHHTRLDAKAHHRDCVQELGVESEDWRAVGQRCREQGFGLLRLTNRRAIDDAFRGLPGYTGARFQPAPRFVSFTWLVPVRERGLGVVCAFHSLCSVVLCCAVLCSGVLWCALLGKQRLPRAWATAVRGRDADRFMERERARPDCVVRKVPSWQRSCMVGLAGCGHRLCAGLLVQRTS